MINPKVGFLTPGWETRNNVEELLDLEERALSELRKLEVYIINIPGIAQILRSGDTDLVIVCFTRIADAALTPYPTTELPRYPPLL